MRKKTYSALTRMTALLLVLVCMLGLLPSTALAANPSTIKMDDCAYEKNAAKITELQARQEELSKQRIELENLDIIGLVRNMGLDPDQLAALIHTARVTSSVKTEGALVGEGDTGHEEV